MIVLKRSLLLLPVATGLCPAPSAAGVTSRPKSSLHLPAAIGFT
ncbi:MAG TPA: hypothetical protein VMX35_14185 [Acidobacteriota bacterium]|nr:hypothetical protein [Acidobacteriota bacterium]